MFYGNVVLCMTVAYLMHVFEDKSPVANPERGPSPSIADAGIEIDFPKTDECLSRPEGFFLRNSVR